MRPLTGRLGADPEVYAPQSSEYSVLKFNIANNDKSKKTDNGWEDVTSWFTIKFWTKNPKDWLCRLKKGIEVLVDAEPEEERWEKDGQFRSKIVFVVRRGTFPKKITMWEKIGSNDTTPASVAGHDTGHDKWGKYRNQPAPGKKEDDFDEMPF